MAFLVQKKRARWAQTRLQKYLRKMTMDDTLELAYECGLHECITYTEDMQGFNYDFTDMQMIAFAAAVCALMEVRGDA
jgi:hypothetical protein